MFTKMYVFLRASACRLIMSAVAITLSASWTIADPLDEAIQSRNDLEKSRDVYRHPKETLLFFDVQPGMTVVETLPGRGWYSKILVPYLGPSGHFIAANYPLDLAAKVFGERWDSMRERLEGWPETFPVWASTLSVDPPKIATYYITQAPLSLVGSVDRILFIRSLHHLNRFDPQMLDNAAEESFRLLKPGGIVGVVQHRAPPANSEQWADGSSGYLHTSRVVAAFESAGLKLAEESQLNANPNDVPTESDRVWRLPPTLRAENDEERQHSINVGESDRMTLKFVKLVK